MSTTNRRETLAAWGALLTLIPAVVVINFQVYWVRVLFIKAHPEEVAVKPPTISGAISDPAIGVPFAHWMSVMAPALLVGLFLVGYLLVCAWRRGIASPALGERGMRVFWGMSTVVQLVSSVGILLLSWNRFPEGRDLHMLGSYIFFAAQFVMIVIVGLWCRTMVVRTQEWRALGYSRGYLARLGRLYPFVALLYPLYLGLFVGKDLVPQAIWPVVIQVYVWMELAVISVTLLFGLLLALPAVRVLRSQP